MRATAHPTRLRILSLLTGAEMSAAEVARELSITQANASYHLRLLSRAGLVDVVGEEKIRGGVAKRYRHIPHGDRTSDQAKRRDPQTSLWQAMAHELIRRAQLEDPEPTVRRLLCDAELWVSPDVWQRAQELVLEASDLLHGSAKPPRSTGTVHVNAQAALFPMIETENR